MKITPREAGFDAKRRRRGALGISIPECIGAGSHDDTHWHLEKRRRRGALRTSIPECIGAWSHDYTHWHLQKRRRRGALRTGALATHRLP
jgi:hypothetical protein